MAIWVVTLSTAVLEEPPGERPCVVRPLSSWCGPLGKAIITLGFNVLTWKAEIKVPAHSRLLGIKSNRITDLKAFFKERSSV